MHPQERFLTEALAQLCLVFDVISEQLRKQGSRRGRGVSCRLVVGKRGQCL